LLDIIDSRRIDARQIIENLLLQIGQAENLRVLGQKFNAPPSVRSGVLCFVNNQKRMALRRKPAKVSALSQKRCCQRRKKVEGDPSVFPTQSVALRDPDLPKKHIVLADATRKRSLIVGKKYLQPSRTSE
jgi:hypothetical protein